MISRVPALPSPYLCALFFCWLVGIGTASFFVAVPLWVWAASVFPPAVAVVLLVWWLNARRADVEVAAMSPLEQALSCVGSFSLGAALAFSVGNIVFPGRYWAAQACMSLWLMLLGTSQLLRPLPVRWLGLPVLALGVLLLGVWYLGGGLRHS